MEGNMIEFGDTIVDEAGYEDLGHKMGEFPIGCYFDDLEKRTIPWHWHEEMESGVVAKGEIRFRTPNHSFLLTKGDAFFVNSGILHEIQRSAEGPCEVQILAFHPRLIGEEESVYWKKYVLPFLEHPEMEGSGFSRTLWKMPGDLIEEAWMGCVEEEEGYEILVRENLTRLLLLLGRRPGEDCRAGAKERARRNNERIKQMLTFIRQHYGERVTVKEIAASASVSESECLRCFRNVLDTTPVACLKECRLQTAAKLLAGTSVRISEIAYQCGFSDMSYFARSFREKYHCTPSAYRDRAGSSAVPARGKY